MTTKASRQDKSQPSGRRTHRDQNSDDDDDDKEESQDSIESASAEPPSPRCMSRDDVLASLGYRSGHPPQQAADPTPSAAPGQQSKVCRRCGKKVYPLELIDIGDCYHRGCFKCHVCSLQLTLKTFSRASSDGSSKEIYCRTHVPKVNATSVGGDAVGIRTALDAQKQASEKLIRQYEQSPVKYDAKALEFQHARDIKQRQKVKRKSSLKTYKDFKKFGVFDAQEALEKKHRLEEDELYEQMVDERRRQMEELEQSLVSEREHTVRELIAWFENQGITQLEREAGLKKMEQYYKDRREERIKHLLDKMATEEQAAITRLIEKHSQEMLLMIQEKDHEAEELMKSHKEPSIARDSESVRNLDDSQERMLKQSYEKDFEMKEWEEERFEEAHSAGEEEEDMKARETVVEEGVSSDDDVAAEKSAEDDEPMEQQLQQLTESSSGSWESGDDDDDQFDRRNVTVVRETAADIPVSRLKVVPATDRRQTKLPARTSRQGRGSVGIRRTALSTPIKLIERRQDVCHENFQQKKCTDAETQVELSESRRTSRRQLVEEDTQTEPVVMPRASKNKSRDEMAADDDDNDARKHRHSMADKHRRKDEQQTQSPSRSRDRKQRSSSPSRSKQAAAVVGQPGKHFQVTISMEKIAGETSMEQQRDSDDLPPPYSARPEICPPSCPKSKLYRSADVFKDFDRRAIKEAQRDPVSFTDLVRRLMRKCETELQRVRAIFRWITAKDLNKIEFSENLDTESPMGLLRGIKFGTETYHNLFKRLCSYAGLHCEVIEGYSKGAGYQPGSHFRGPQFRNQWTAVWVERSWRFINCNWGARHVKRPGDDQSLTYHVDEFYFLTDPEEHIYQHLPDDQRWQLLHRPVTMEDFVRLPLVKSPFFNHRLQFAATTEAVVRAVDGHIDIRLIAPSLLGFAAKLRSMKDDGSNLNDRCLVRTICNMVVVSAALPKPGRYYLDVYVGADWSNSSMDSACSLRVHGRSVAPSVAAASYPPGICFGPTPDCSRYGIADDSRHDPVVVADGTQLSLRLRTTPRRDLDMRLTHTMRYWKHGTLTDCDRYALLQKRDASGSAKWIVRCPKPGFYAVSITAALGDESSTCVYRYLLDCRRPCSDARPMPRATTRWNGCRLVEPLNGELAPRSKVRFRIESSVAVEMMANVAGAGWTSLERSGDVWEALVETGDVPADGRGRLQVYARFEASSDKYVPLLDYVVREPSLTDEVRTMLKYL